MDTEIRLLEEDYEWLRPQRCSTLTVLVTSDRDQKKCGNDCVDARSQKEMKGPRRHRELETKIVYLLNEKLLVLCA